MDGRDFVGFKREDSNCLGVEQVDEVDGELCVQAYRGYISAPRHGWEEVPSYLSRLKVVIKWSFCL